MLQRLSVFRGGFSVSDAEAVWRDGRPVAKGSNTTESAAVIERLVARSLVGVDLDAARECRLSLTEVVRQYGQRQLRDAGELEAFRERYGSRPMCA